VFCVRRFFKNCVAIKDNKNKNIFRDISEQKKKTLRLIKFPENRFNQSINRRRKKNIFCHLYINIVTI